METDAHYPTAKSWIVLKQRMGATVPPRTSIGVGPPCCQNRTVYLQLYFTHGCGDVIPLEVVATPPAMLVFLGSLLFRGQGEYARVLADNGHGHAILLYTYTVPRHVVEARLNPLSTHLKALRSVGASEVQRWGLPPGDALEKFSGKCNPSFRPKGLPPFSQRQGFRDWFRVY